MTRSKGSSGIEISNSFVVKMTNNSSNKCKRAFMDRSLTTSELYCYHSSFFVELLAIRIKKLLEIQISIIVVG
jgi:hypothetical protein